jgi:metal-responsive CopG/Arc/MetJ family transcriptional regulator
MSRILSVSVPDALVEEVEARAAAQGRTKSEFVRDALRRQLELERFRELQRFAREQAERRGYGPEDADALVDEVRSGRV